MPNELKTWNRLPTWRKWVVALMLLVPSFSFAQQAEELEELEAFVMTGTRLTGATIEGSLPLLSFGETDLDFSAATTAAEFLRNLPIIGGPSTQASNFSNGTDGAARVGLRNIEGGNTLILFNGRRLQTTGTGGTSDLNQIPLAAIKRVEILKAGGSTVYGTSAVAGVINFILDKEFEGMEINAGYANTFDTDVHETTMNFIVGGTGAGGKFSYTMGGGYREQAAMLAKDRSYMIGGGTSILPNPGLFFFGSKVSAEIIAANGYAANELTGRGTWWTLKNGVDVASSPSDFKPFVNQMPYSTDALGRNGDRFPFENYTISMSPNKQHNFFSTTDYKISDTVTFFTEMAFAYSEMTFQLAAAPVSTLRVTPTNYWYNQIFSSDAIQADASTSATAARGPSAYYRFMELGPRYNHVERRNVRLVAGVNAELPMNFSLEAYAMYTEEFGKDAELNGGSLPLVQEMLGFSGPDAYNMFAASWIRGTEVGGGFENPANPNKDLADQIRADNNTEFSSKRQLFDIRVANSELFTLPAGPVQIVAGFEFRDEKALSKPDFLKLQGSLGWNAADGATIGNREVWGLYGEVQLPIIDKLELNLSARYEDYADEFSTDVIGANLRYQPIEDLTLRASYSQAFVAPEITDIFNPGFGSFPELSDPFFPSGDPDRLYQIETSYVGSVFSGVALLPETADIYSVGLTYSPRGIKNLNVTVDWFSIEKENLIVYSVQGLVTEFRQSYSGGADGSMTHPPANNPFLSENGGVVVYDPDSGSPIRRLLNVGPRNVAGQKLEGVDVDVDYRLEFDQWGTIDFDASLTYFMNMEQQSATTGNWFSYLGQYDGDVAYPRIKTLISAIHSIGDLSYGFYIRHQGRTRDTNQVQEKGFYNYDPAAKHYVEVHSEVDMTIQYKLPFFRGGLRESTITAGIQNLFDEEPPLMGTAFSNNYPERNYDPRGRYYFIRFNQKF